MKSFCCLLLLSGLSCATSPHLREEHVRYEFMKEGFLAPDFIQVIGTAAYRRASSLQNAQAFCLSDASRASRQRLLRIFLNTALSVRENPGLGGGLETDYPANYSLATYIQAEWIFERLLERSYIALQDLRDPQQCMVVLRLQGPELAREIRSFGPALAGLKKEAPTGKDIRQLQQAGPSR